jgi:ATP-dependent helicase HrpB
VHEARALASVRRVMDLRRPPTDLPVEEVLDELRGASPATGSRCSRRRRARARAPSSPSTSARPGSRHRPPGWSSSSPAASPPGRWPGGWPAQLGEDLGGVVGLVTRDERRVSGRTAIEVVTEGVLLRRLQRDPTLAGTGLVFLDEFHERNLDADLSLAFVLEARQALRPELRVLVASATLDGPRIARLLDDAPIVAASGRAYAVTVEHRPRPGRHELAAAVVAAVGEVLTRQEGDVLVFLPGAAEIRRCRRVLADAAFGPGVVVRPLYGALPAEEQDLALAPDPEGRRKVVLATDLAETSLTIEGVHAVVDAGLAREPRFDAATGMTGLVTVPASRASADQRAGRAGRTAPGFALRLWPEREHHGRDAHPRPAIRTDDLVRPALEVAAWGAEVGELALLDQPPEAGWARARATLVELGALGRDGRITPHGRRLADLPVHPRLAHLVTVGVARGRGGLACEAAAALSDRDPVITDRDRPSADLTARIRLLRGQEGPPGARLRAGARSRVRREARRLARAVGVELTGRDDPDALGGLVAAAWPERVALARPDRRGSYLLAGGRGATLDERDPLAGERWLAVAHVDRGDREARIHLAAPVDPRLLRDVLPAHVSRAAVVGWEDGDVVAEEREQLGAVVLQRRRLPTPAPDGLLAALLDGLRREGLELLRWGRDDRTLQARVALLHRELGPSWPDLSDAALLADLERIVGPFLLGARRRADLARVPAGDVLRSQLSPSQLADLDRLAPTHLTVPSGSRVRLGYDAEGGRPVLAVRVQELFGADRTPAIVAGRTPVMLHLLSPARRPVQVTDDLAGFWERTYPKVRSELRGRYPKHAWPEDPTDAAPLRGTPRRR